MRLPEPDFLRPRRGIPAIGKLFAAAAGAVLFTAAADAWQAWTERAEAIESLAVLQAAPAARSAAQRPDDAAVAPLRRTLDAAWHRHFEAIESATVPGIAWLALDLDHRGTLQLVGTGPDAAAALATAERLRAHAPWSAAVVARIEQGQGAQQRFEIRAGSDEPKR